MLAAYTFGQAMWTMFVFFMWILWFWLLFTVFGDLFRRHDISGWGKAGWTLFVIILPFLGVFIYLIAEGKNASEQIAKAKELLDSGAISQAEFDQLKAKALAA